MRKVMKSNIPHAQSYMQAPQAINHIYQHSVLLHTVVLVNSLFRKKFNF